MTSTSTKVHFLQVQRNLRSALPDLRLQFLQVLRSHSAYESNRRAEPIGIPFDF